MLLYVFLLSIRKGKSRRRTCLERSALASNADNAGVTPPQPNVWANPLLRSLVVDEARASKTMVDILQGYGAVPDPRLTLILSKSQAWVQGKDGAEEWKGVPNGLPVTELSLPEYDNNHNSCIWGYMWGYDWNSAEKAITSQSPNRRRLHSAGTDELLGSVLPESRSCFARLARSRRCQTNYETVFAPHSRK